jgi:hypothetical protein
VRTSIILLSIAMLTVCSAAGQSTVSPDALLQRGIDSYRTDDDASAVRDLEAAAQGYLSTEEMQTYTRTGRFENLQSFEKALVYLTLAQYRLGRENDARETVIRLTTAERIAPTFASLPLDPDAADFEAVAERLVPTAELPANEQLGRGDTPLTALPRVQAALPPVQPVEVPPAQPVVEARGQDAYLTSLRQAETYATNDQIELANEIYERIAHDTSAPREVLAQAAIGLYRTGAFLPGTEAFGRLVPFAKGEEDLRYYYAVALFEVGNFTESRRELACALPFIELTDDVVRYRTKIEGTTSLQAKND